TMALRGLSASQPRMRADTHGGPEQIAPLQRPDTLMQLSRSLILEVHLVPHGRAIHCGTKRTCRPRRSASALRTKRTSVSDSKRLECDGKPHGTSAHAVRSLSKVGFVPGECY